MFFNTGKHRHHQRYTRLHTWVSLSEFKQQIINVNLIDRRDGCPERVGGNEKIKKYNDRRNAFMWWGELWDESRNHEHWPEGMENGHQIYRVFGHFNVRKNSRKTIRSVGGFLAAQAYTRLSSHNRLISDAISGTFISLDLNTWSDLIANALRNSADILMPCDVIFCLFSRAAHRLLFNSFFVSLFLSSIQYYRATRILAFKKKLRRKRIGVRTTRILPDSWSRYSFQLFRQAHTFCGIGSCGWRWYIFPIDHAKHQIIK